MLFCSIYTLHLLQSVSERHLLETLQHSYETFFSKNAVFSLKIIYTFLSTLSTLSTLFYTFLLLFPFTAFYTHTISTLLRYLHFTLSTECIGTPLTRNPTTFVCHILLEICDFFLKNYLHFFIYIFYTFYTFLHFFTLFSFYSLLHSYDIYTFALFTLYTFYRLYL